VDVYDSNEHPPLRDELQLQAPEVSVTGGSLKVRRWTDDSLLVVSPGVPLSHPELSPLLETGVRPVGDVELFAQCVRGRVVAITGSNGKSTVTALVGEILRSAGKKVSVGGNIGTPVLELLDDSNERDRIFVLELSSFQLETTWSLDAEIATVLNISADHMDRYSTMEEYISSKLKVFNGNGTMLVNRDDPALQQVAGEGRKLISFGESRPASQSDYGLRVSDGSVALCRGDQVLVEASEIRLAGRHNLLNVLAAWSIASSFAVSDDAIRRAVGLFNGLAHRMEWLRRINDVDWINDSKGTNVGATVAAIKGLSRPVVLIAGGIAKDADFGPLREAIAGKVKAVVLFGQDARKIESALGEAVPVHMAKDLHDAVKQAANIAQPGQVALFSPACASFDMYRNFEQRGDDFRRCVGGLD
jgi:UDP-N-acetylmuramoylalanine--D-glutamate ligase